MGTTLNFTSNGKFPIQRNYNRGSIILALAQPATSVTRYDATFYGQTLSSDSWRARYQRTISPVVSRKVLCSSSSCTIKFCIELQTISHLEGGKLWGK